MGYVPECFGTHNPDNKECRTCDLEKACWEQTPRFECGASIATAPYPCCCTLVSGSRCCAEAYQER